MKFSLTFLIILLNIYADSSFKEYQNNINKYYSKNKSNESTQNYNNFEKENGYTSFRTKIKETGKIPILDEEVKTAKGDSSMSMP